MLAKSIISQPITMVSGRGGTGKTEVVSKVLAAAKNMIDVSDEKNSDDGLENEHFVGTILYTAPTGKAASVIKKRVRASAFTIH